MNNDAELLQSWVGRTESHSDLVTAVPVTALAAMLDRADDQIKIGAELPPLWHWLYFLPLARQSEVGPDGHPQRGGFMPPVPLPRRMWAGSRLRFERPLCIGAQITKTSRITDVQWKQGRSGRLAFVQVEHCIEDASGLLLVEAQDIVYREAAQAGDPLPAPQAAPAKAVWRREIYPDPVLLFRYSALTFNGHRIHYDLPYAIGVEHYPERVVHGPLIATLLLDLLRREAPQQRVMAFSFRAVRPLFQGAPFHVCGQPASDGKTAHLWAQDADGGLAMDATAELA